MYFPSLPLASVKELAVVDAAVASSAPVGNHPVGSGAAAEGPVPTKFVGIGDNLKLVTAEHIPEEVVAEVVVETVGPKLAEDEEID